MDLIRRESYVGSVDDHVTRKGWFFGAFVDNKLLKSDLVEVAWQKIPHLTPSPEQSHFHERTVEINIIIQGWMELLIDGVKHRLEKGQFYVIWPESIVADITTGKDTELIVVRAPSLPGDKVLVNPDK